MTSSIDMHAARVVADSADELYRKTLALVRVAGVESAPRGMATREVLGATLCLTDARANVVTIPARRLNYTFSVAEWLWMMLGRDDVKSIAYFNAKIADFSDDGVTFAGAYGPKFVAQYAHVLGALAADPSSRQAVLTFWRPSPAPSKDIPCTVAIQFLLRAGALHAITFMRSNDAWLGFPYDLFSFTQLQAVLAAQLGVGVGSYTHNVGSLHLYAQHYEKARVVEDAPAPLAVTSPAMTPPTAFLDALFPVLGADTPLSRNLRPSSFPSPWDVYFSVLAYRTHRDAARVLEPYRSLITNAERGGTDGR